MIDVRFHVGNLGYRLRVRQDRHRGGYEAVLTTDDGGPLMMPNGSSPGDAIARLVRELTAGDAFDRKIAKEIVERTGFPDAFPGVFATGRSSRSHATKKGLKASEYTKLVTATSVPGIEKYINEFAYSTNYRVDPMTLQITNVVKPPPESWFVMPHRGGFLFGRKH